MIHCYALCPYRDVLDALGLRDTDLYDDDNIHDALNPIKTYPYAGGRKNHRGLTADGSKTFWQEGSGDKSLYGVDRIGDDTVVFFCEGEKGVDFLRALGHAAVATGGAQRTCDLTPLANRIVIIIADRDKTGHQWAQRHAKALSNIASSVCITQAKIDIDKADIVEHISAGYDIGELEPVPVDDTNGHATEHEIGRRIEWTIASEVRDAVPVWAWEYAGRGRIQLGTLALFAGRPGAGKSSAARWFAAQATKGLLEGQWHETPQQVAYIATAEESTRYTITPGLRAAGADLGKIHYPSVFRDGEPAQLLSIVDEMTLIDYLLRNHITIVIVDPLMSTISAASDINKNNEVRAYIQPWARIADTINGIVIGVVHLRKNNTGDVVAAVTGSSAFGEVSRAIFGFAKNPVDDTRVMSQHKNSTGFEDLSLAYEINSEIVTVSTGETADFGVFHITGPSEITVEDLLMDSGGQQTGTGIECQRWLHDYLSVEGPVKSKTVKIDAAKEGYSQRTVERAAKKLKVEMRSQDFPRSTYWSMPVVVDITQSRHSDARE